MLYKNLPRRLRMTAKTIARALGLSARVSCELAFEFALVLAFVVWHWRAAVRSVVAQPLDVQLWIFAVLAGTAIIWSMQHA